jgi:hypothetical protein
MRIVSTALVFSLWGFPAFAAPQIDTAALLQILGSYVYANEMMSVQLRHAQERIGELEQGLKDQADSKPEQKPPPVNHGEQN